MSLFSMSVMNDIMAQLKQQNPSLPSTVTPEDVRLTLVKSLSSHSSGKNTRAVVSVIDHGRVKGFKPIYYNRVNLGSVLRNISYVFPKGSAVRLSDLLPAINGRYGLGLTINDIVDANLPVVDGVVGVTLQTKPKSLSWYGSATLFVESSSVQANRPPRTTAVVNLGSVERDGSLTVTQNMLLANVIDDDGDTLTVSDLHATSVNGYISGTGPWIFNGLSNGSFTASYTVSDGRGGTVIQYAVLEVIEPTSTETLPPLTFQLIPTVEGALDSELLMGNAVVDLTVSGNFVQGSVLTLTSSTLAFTGGMPEKQVYNDYSTGTPGEQVQTLAELGTWDRGHAENGKYAEAGMNGRPAIYYCNHEDGGKIVRRNIVYPPGFGEAFCASSLRVPAGKTLGGANQYWPNSTPVPRTIIGRSQLKMFWLNVNDGGGEPADLIMPTLVSQAWQYGGNSHALSAWGNVDIDANTLWDWDGWNFFRCWAKHNPADWDAGIMQLEVSSSLGRNKKSMLGPVLNDTPDAPLFNDIAFGKWTEENNLTQILNGDVYIAIGPNAPCRVEIGDKPTYAGCRSIAICPPLSWNQDTRRVEVRYSNGDLVQGRPQFVYLFNKDNELINEHGKLVNYIQPQVVQGGDSALSWRAPSLTTGSVITVETDGTYDFGQGPVSTFKVGFGKGYLYDNPELKVLTTGEDLDDFKVIEGGARRIETIDGVRVMASRTRDTEAWSGFHTAGRMITCDLGTPLTENEKFAAFRLIRTDYNGTPLNWQWKTSRLLSGSMDLDQDVDGEYMAHGSREHTNGLVKYTPVGNRRLPIVHPHANQGWVMHALMIDFGTKGVQDGRVLSYTARQGDSHQFTVVDVHDMVVDPETNRMPQHFGCQDYWDGSNYSPEALADGAYEPEKLDQYTTDILAQRGSFAHVALGDAPTREECRSYVVLTAAHWSRSKLEIDYWPSIGTYASKYLYIHNDDGDLVATVHLEGNYQPPEWIAANDIRGILRPSGSVDSSRRISLSGLKIESNNQKWEFYLKPSSLASVLGICGVTGSTTMVFAFNPDGSISLRMPGMSQIHVVRPAGTHLLNTLSRQKVSLVCTGGTQIDVLVDDVVVASHNGTGLSLSVTRLMDTGLANSGLIGTLYNASYYENDILKHLFTLDEGSGTVVTDKLGGATGTVGSSLFWVT